MFSASAEFVEGLTIQQIQNLLQSKAGYFLIDSVQGFISPNSNSNIVTIDPNKLRQLYMKIERVRIPIIAGDKRPYVGEVVSTDEDMGIDPSTYPQRIPYSLRFGSSHDGEHWLTKTVGAQVKATAGIKGTVLTYYFQENGVGNVMILLGNTKIVMLIKDLVTLGLKIKQAKPSYPDNPNTKNINETIFIDKFGKPLDPVQLNAGDLIGTTMPWSKLGARNYYSGYDGTFGTFHFAFLRYERVQEYRSKIGHKLEKEKATGIADDELIATFSEDLKKKVIPLSWFIPALSPESPVKCFK